MNMKLNNIYNEGCLETMLRMPDNCIDLIITDPPYKIVSGGGTSISGGIFDRKRNKHTSTGKMFENNDIVFDDWLGEVYRVLKPGSHAYIMVSGRRLSDLYRSVENTCFKFQNLLVWDKGNVTPNRYYMQRTEFILLLKKGASRTINNPGLNNILRVNNEVGKKQHPTQKPTELVSIMVLNSSNMNDIVYDPFMGSGATALASQNLNRSFIGSEISKEYCNIAEQRLKQKRLA